MYDDRTGGSCLRPQIVQGSCTDKSLGWLVQDVLSMKGKVDCLTGVSQFFTDLSSGSSGLGHFDESGCFRVHE